MITFELVISVISLLFIKADDHFINDYLQIYENRLKYLNESHIIVDTEDYLLSIFNFIGIRQVMNISITGNSFSFKSVLYTFLFEVQAIHKKNGKSFYKKNQIVEHVYDKIIFTANFENRTFKIQFDHDGKQCSFYLSHLFEHSIFSDIKLSQIKICQRLSLLVELKITRFVENVPLNLDRLNFEDFIIKIGKDSDLKAYCCDYQLNETHKVINFAFNTITYSFHQLNYDSCDFYNIRVNITYSVVDNETKIGVSEIGIIGFKYIRFGQNKFLFFEEIIVNDYLGNLIQKNMILFEKNRPWISNEFE